MTPAESERRWVQAPAMLISAAAWALLAVAAGGVALPALCAGVVSPALPAAIPSAASVDLALALNPPAALAAGWAVMLAAMMTPLLAAPVGHVRERSFAGRQARAIALFVAGYAACWMAAGAVLLTLAIAARLIAPGSPLPALLAALVALVWQGSSAKRRCLDRCHTRPGLAAFGKAADRDALRFGLSHGGWCVGACWALMLAPQFLAHGHVAAMALVALWLFAERLERPGKEMRIAVARIRPIQQRQGDGCDGDRVGHPGLSGRRPARRRRTL